MEGFNASFSLSSLLCKEDESSLIEHEEPDINLSSCSVSESEDEYIQNLIERETSFESNSFVSSIDCSETSKNWLKFARLDAIKWILHTRAFFGFHFHTAYLSLTYFDRFLSRRSVDNGKVWAIQLLSVACLSLAAKMEECKVPALSEYPVDEYNFESIVIQRMELFVLIALEWKLGSITPFAYLHYFITKFYGDSSPKELVSKTIELILAITKEINLMDHRPSVIAAAAILAACDDQLTRKKVELKTSLIKSWGSLEKEIEMGKSMTPTSLMSPNVLSTHSSSGDVLENSSVISAVGTKRKLTYNDCDKHYPLQNIRRP